MRLDSPDAVAASLARLIAITGGMDVIDNLFAAYDRVTPKDIRAAVRLYLTAERRTIVTLTGRK
jgi:zinc protease